MTSVLLGLLFQSTAEAEDKCQDPRDKAWRDCAAEIADYTQGLVVPADSGHLLGAINAQYDVLENDFSGAMHRKVIVSSKRGMEDSANPFERERILREARIVYDSAD